MEFYGCTDSNSSHYNQLMYRACNHQMIILIEKVRAVEPIHLPSQKVTDLETKAQLVVPKAVWREFL